MFSLRPMLLILMMLTLVTAGRAQDYDTLRVATYNLLNYPGTTSSARNPEFRKTLHAMDPDILIVQEMTSSAGVAEFLGQVLNFGQPGTYTNAPFSNGPDTDNALYYKPSRVSFLSQIVLETALRDINGYVLRPAGVSSDSLDFRIYSAHLKASQGEEAARFAEADTLRNHLNALGPGYYIFGGDFNLYTSSEDAYQELIGSQADNDGRLYDPLGQPGSWHDNSSFAAVHTQSPRLTDLGDGGATGGLDDRFDFLLPSFPFQTLPGWRVVPGSYTEYGNDGAHYGQAVNNGTNFAVPDSIADALHVSSDHLPVFFEIYRQITPSPTVSLIAPDGGESFGTGDTLSVQWSTQNYSGTVSIFLSRSGAGGPFETLVAGTANDGSFAWITAGAATSTARVKIVLDGAPTVTDISASDFAITLRELLLLSPVEAAEYPIGGNVDIFWQASGVTGNLKLELRRSPAAGTWETLSASVPNTGSYLWLAQGSATDSARVRLSSLTTPGLADTSGMFRLLQPTLTLVRPNGGELFSSGANEQIQWTQSALTGTVTLEVNRSYPAGAWEVIASSLLAGSSPYIWTVTGPATTTARVRVRSNSLPQVGDSSSSNFTILVNNIPPVLGHNPVCDSEPGLVNFFATLSDDGGFGLPYLVWSNDSFVTRDSTIMSHVYGSVYSVANLFDAGYYDYFIRVTDAGNLTSTTDTLRLRVADECGVLISYDDSTPESYQWSPTEGFAWAVRFTPPSTPFVLCAADYAVSKLRPDTLHSPMVVRVLDANGIGGLPGDTLASFSSGVLPNPLSGQYGTSPGWGQTVLHESDTGLVVVYGDFYVSVSGDSVAWGLDSNGVAVQRSVVWDPCELSWLPEYGLAPTSRAGQRMIRVIGWPLLPPVLVISTSGSDAILRWESTGAPHYVIYRSANPQGPFDVPLAVVSETSYTDPGVIGSLGMAFYVVRSSQ